MSGDRVLSIERALVRVMERIGEAAIRSGRQPAAVTLVAVTKTLSADDVVTAFHAGARHFGENRVEEGQPKIRVVTSRLTGHAPLWHMIGHVQSRKAADVAGTFDMVHSVDSVKLARRLGRFAAESGKTLPVLLECNVSGEAAKYGFAAGCWRSDEAQRLALWAAFEEILQVPGICVEGLMTMAPLVSDAEQARPVFSQLRALLHEAQERYPIAQWRHLSMGMTDDFEVAVEEGATMVRIGRAVFGSLSS